MPKQRFPRVEYAFFCEHVEVDGLGFTTATRLKHSVPMVPGATSGIAMWLVFGVEGKPKAETTLRLTIVWPSGKSRTNDIILKIGEHGFIEVRANMSPLVVNEVGHLRAEFRFDSDSEPRHVARLAILDAPFSILPTAPPNAAPTH